MVSILDWAGISNVEVTDPASMSKVSSTRKLER
jgi:hypothetical protein